MEGLKDRSDNAVSESTVELLRTSDSVGTSRFPSESGSVFLNYKVDVAPVGYKNCITDADKFPSRLPSSDLLLTPSLSHCSSQVDNLNSSGPTSGHNATESSYFTLQGAPLCNNFSSQSSWIHGEESDHDLPHNNSSYSSSEITSAQSSNQKVYLPSIPRFNFLTNFNENTEAGSLTRKCVPPTQRFFSASSPSKEFSLSRSRSNEGQLSSRVNSLSRDYPSLSAITFSNNSESTSGVQRSDCMIPTSHFISSENFLSCNEDFGECRTLPSPGNDDDLDSLWVLQQGVSAELKVSPASVSPLSGKKVTSLQHFSVVSSRERSASATGMPAYRKQHSRQQSLTSTDPYTHMDQHSLPEETIFSTTSLTRSPRGSARPRHRFKTRLMIGVECSVCHRPVYWCKVCRFCKQKFHRHCLSKASYCHSLRQFDSRKHHTKSANNSPHEQTRFRQFLGDNISLSVSSNQSPSDRVIQEVTFSPYGGNHFSFNEKGSPASALATRFPFPDVGNTNSPDESTRTPSLSDGRLSSPLNLYLQSPTVIVDKDTSEDVVLRHAPPRDVSSNVSGEESSLDDTRMSVALEWDISYNELVLEEKIESGVYVDLYKGRWHGQVWIKTINMDVCHMNPHNASMCEVRLLTAFKDEVSMLRKTRHDNLALFMGASTTPPKLAIVTGLPGDMSLYTYLYRRKVRPDLRRAADIASQVSQGMSYLHARGLLHKDLSSKNVALGSSVKVVITEFGLSSLIRLSARQHRANKLSVSLEWLAYLAPELVRSLHVGKDPFMCDSKGESDFRYSVSTDIYAFGTLWCELLRYELPWVSQRSPRLDPESVIWQVGSGLKPKLTSRRSDAIVEEILQRCWDVLPERRPQFKSLSQSFDRLCRQQLRLCRFPSHPSPCKSMDSLF